MAITGETLVALADLIYETPGDTEGYVTDLDPDVEAYISERVDEWEPARNSFVKLKGGSEGLDFDNARKRAAIFYRVRSLLGLPYVVFPELAVDTLQIFELEVGGSFL